MAASSIVIKVKYGETLRRFNASIDDKKLALDIVTLKEKIRSLFSFGSDVEFTLIYVDEDGDSVTLADDDDLHDVVRQSLNPLRITVNLKNGNPNGSSGTSTPLRSPQQQIPIQFLNSGVAEFLKAVPEPLHEAIAKFQQEVTSKASSSAPAVAEFLKNVPEPLREAIAKFQQELTSKASSSAPTAAAHLVERMKSFHLNQISASKASPIVNPPTNGAPMVNESSTVKDSNVNKEAWSSNIKKKEKPVKKATEVPRSVDLNIPYFGYESLQAPNTATNEVGEGSRGKPKNTTDGVEKKQDDVSSRLHLPLINQINQFNAKVSAEAKKATNDSGSSSRWGQGMLNATNQCPFMGIPLPNVNESDSQGYYRHSRSPHWKRYGLDNNGIGNIFHRGVRCDGCGVHPITGPRFKSKVKDDYDLCSVCFAGNPNVADYIRIDRPTNAFRHHVPFKGLYDHSLRVLPPPPPPPTLPHAMRAPGSKIPKSKLDSRFILDVNVLDGTAMAPFTPFTKIWRMRNNGSIIWPHGSQLQWIGGDRLSNSQTVDVEIPAGGLPVEKELDVAVDFTAPELPGRYISYWRMASPSGQKFGQRVWVLIQVDACMKDLGETSINLNLPPVMRSNEGYNQDPKNLIKLTDPKTTSVGPQPKDHEMNFPINDSLIIDNGVLSSTTPPASPHVFSSSEVESALASLPTGPTIELDASLLEPINYPTVDYSVMSPIVDSAPPSPLGSGSQDVSVDQELALMKDLEDMGFKQMDVNKEVLRKNNYDLEKSIDALCDVSEWDPMLEELQEMGFEDNEANMRLLKKNNGSIKRVVMDLINGENA